jgi:hypothetical protein
VACAAAAHIQLSSLDTESNRVLIDLVGACGWTVLSKAYLALGELDAAEDPTLRARQCAQATSLPQPLAAVICARARVMLVRGDSQAAVTGPAMTACPAASWRRPAARVSVS